jgi:hypothetical protein
MMFLCNRKTAITGGLLVAGAVVAVGGWCLYSGVSVSLEAEKTLHAYGMVLDLVSTYVEKTSGQWPRNWDDLRQLSTSRESCGWQWPRDLEEIQKRILCDFSVTCSEVAKQNPEDFHAIEQIGPNYGSYDSQVLMSVCKKYAQDAASNSQKHGAVH